MVQFAGSVRGMDIFAALGDFLVHSGGGYFLYPGAWGLGTGNG